MILRPYQTEIVEAVEAVFGPELFRAPIVVLSTGGGKTVVFSKVTLDEIAKGSVVWIVAHRQELIYQASKTLTSFGIHHGVIKAGVKPHPERQVQVASIQTLTRRLKDQRPPDLIIIDECHHSVAQGYRNVFAAYPNHRRLGVTATPCRMTGAGLGEIFDIMIHGPTNQFLTDNKFLCPARYYAPPQQADFTRVKVSKGDYDTKELEVVMDEPSITGDAVQHYQRICDGAPMLTFCVSVEHARHVAQQYLDAGYRAACVDGTLSDEDRADRINGLGTGKYQIITSCDLIGEGLDVPVVTVAQLLRPTKSVALHLQQIGRVLRPSPGKEYAIILDHVGNTAKHGFASTDFKWSLDEGVKKKKGDVPVATRTCEKCYSVHKTAKACPYCGFTYPIKQKSLSRTEVIDGQLVQVDETKEERMEELKNARSMPELIAFAKARGYNRPTFWARKVYHGRSYITDMPRLS